VLKIVFTKNNNKLIHKNRLKFVLWISLLLFLFPSDYVDLKQYPDWLKITIIEILSAVALKLMAHTET